ncbi:hypothetical protein GQ55_5G300000 [Panicum hallii var. hallii]|uniref:TTF-type domain-containing protein n=1 Tax=Panicum hallii var. hallii TaxID=1504633 RepID=A0A2T7DLI2_9POAL|nr:hypothetical protein GQ55_5G300000 [Panicum hallii var. hallii]
MSKRTLLTYFSSSSSKTNDNTPKTPRVEFRCSDIISDPGMRKPIDEYPSKIRDQVKRAYILSGPTQQALGFTYPRKWQSGEWRSFSAALDAAFCFYFYLFFELGKPENFGSNVFPKVGYKQYKKALEKFDKHAASQSHCNSRLKCDDFMNQRTSVARKIEKYTKEEERRYKIRLTSSIDVARFLIMQGDA